MKVFYCSDGYTSHDYRFLVAFSNAGCDVSFLQLTDMVYEPRSIPPQVKHYSFGHPATLDFDKNKCYDAARWYHAIWKTQKPDVALAGSIQKSGFIVAISESCPYVAMSWGTDILVDAEQSSDMQERTRLTVGNADGWFGDCRAVRDKFIYYGASPASYIETFPWGLDLETLNSVNSHDTVELPSKFTNTADRVVFICSRSWEPVYAIDILVEAFARLRKAYANVFLILLGDGSQKDSIMRLVSDLGIDDIVHMPGRMSGSDVIGYFKASDVYVSTALSDGISISLLEAMACGLPVVVADAFGNSEMVVDGENGWLSRAVTVEDFHSAFLRALQSRESYADISLYNKHAVKNKADWNANFPRLVGLLEKASSKY